MKILVTPTSFGPFVRTEAKERLEAFADELIYNPYGRPLAEDELIPLLEDCDGYLAGLDSITGKVLKSCRRLKSISRYGAGYDRVDVAAAKAAGIIVTTTPGVNSTAVADLAIGLALAVARRIPMLDRTTRTGQWVRSTGVELSGKTLGILGLGTIGKNVAKRARGFDMKILAYDPFLDRDYARRHEIQACTLKEVLEQSDVVSLHLPLNDGTRHLIGAEAIGRMKPGSILINTSRGGIIDESAAEEALESGRLGGLGLDAFEKEPPEGNGLFRFDNVVVTPHTGAHTAEATRKMADAAVDNLIAVLEGRECASAVTM